MARKVAKGPRPKHVPRRTCVACRQGDTKRALVRIVRMPAGDIRVDSSGKLSGRGAYVCSARACWDIALKKRILDHALKRALTAEEVASLEQFAAGLPGVVVEKGGE